MKKELDDKHFFIEINEAMNKVINQLIKKIKIKRPNIVTLNRNY